MEKMSHFVSLVPSVSTTSDHSHRPRRLQSNGRSRRIRSRRRFIVQRPTTTSVAVGPSPLSSSSDPPTSNNEQQVKFILFKSKSME